MHFKYFSTYCTCVGGRAALNINIARAVQVLLATV